MARRRRIARKRKRKADGPLQIPEAVAVKLLKKLDDDALARIAFSLFFVRFFTLENFAPVGTATHTILKRLRRLNRAYEAAKPAISWVNSNKSWDVLDQKFIRRFLFFTNLLFVQLPGLIVALVELLDLLGKVNVVSIRTDPVETPPTI